MLKLVTFLLTFIPLCFCSRLSLYGKTLDGKDSVGLGEYEYNDETNQITIINDKTDLYKDDVPYCIGMRSNDGKYEHSCFTLIELQKPLSYELVLDIDSVTNEVQKFSLVLNGTLEGIHPIIHEPTDAPMSPAIKLKKTTKTYADKRREVKSGSEQFSKIDKDENDEEVDDRNYLQKNWKQLLIGLVIYNLVTGFLKPSDSKDKK